MTITWALFPIARIYQPNRQLWRTATTFPRFRDGLALGLCALGMRLVSSIEVYCGSFATVGDVRARSAYPPKLTLIPDILDGQLCDFADIEFALAVRLTAGARVA
jgi:hypothetical protein